MKLSSNLVLAVGQVLAIGLLAVLTTRNALILLGESGFGTFLILNGSAIFFYVLNGATISASQRALTIARAEKKPVRPVFAACLARHLSISLVIGFGGLIIAEPLVGQFERANGLDPNQGVQAFRLITAACLAGAVASAFEAYAWSKRNLIPFFASSVLNSAGLYTATVVLLRTGGDVTLIEYALAVATIGGVTSLLGIFTVILIYPETRISIRELFQQRETNADNSLFLWNTVGSLAFLLQQHGMVLASGLFAGPAAAASIGVANQAASMIRGVTQAAGSALAPIIYSATSEGNFAGVADKAVMTSKILFYLCICASIPILAETDQFLSTWLHTPPSQASLFTKATVTALSLEALSSQVWYAWQATGRTARLVGFSIALSIVGVTTCAALFALTESIELVAVALLIWSGISATGRVYLFRRNCPDVVHIWMRGALLPSLLVYGACLSAAFLLLMLLPASLYRFAAITAATTTIVLIAAWRELPPLVRPTESD